jgi:hypothetical protein
MLAMRTSSPNHSRAAGSTGPVSQSAAPSTIKAVIVAK